MEAKFSFSDRYNLVCEKFKNYKELSDEELLNLKLLATEVYDEYDNFQLVVKRNCNSLYGVSANKFFSLHDTDVAEDITVTGKHFAVIVDRAINRFFQTWNTPETIKTIQKFYPEVTKIRNYTEYVPDTKNDLCCYGDTDSRYFRNDIVYDLIGKKLPESDIELADFSVFLDNEFISKIIKTTIDRDCELRNARKGYLKMTHEVTTRKCIFMKKKKYIMTPIWTDGKSHGIKLKFKGVELKKGSMSEKAKKILSVLITKYLLKGVTAEELRKECLKIIQYIKLKKDKELIYLISSVSGLSNITQNSDNVWVTDKSHIQMQMAVAWNNFIEENNLKEIYRPAFEGQKMQYYYCDESSGYKVIGIPDDFNITEIKELPEPDWNKMIIQTLIKPLCRYILDKQDIDDKDVEAFLLGVKIWNFSKM